MSLVGVNLKFLSHQEGSYKFTVAYTINQRYKYFINVKSNVRPLKLHFETQKIVLWADCESQSDSLAVDNDEERIFSPNVVAPPTEREFTTPKAVHKLLVKNDGNYPCSFSCHIERQSPSKANMSGSFSMDGILKIEPQMAEIGPRQSKTVMVSYSPGVKSKLEAKIIFEVQDDFEGGKKLLDTIIIPFEGRIHPPQCSVVGVNARNNLIDFGSIPIQNVPQYDLLLSKRKGTRNTKNHFIVDHQVKLKNSSSCSAIFFANISSGNPDIIVSPNSGTIYGNGTTFNLNVKIIPRKLGLFNEILVIYIAGAEKAIKLPLKYEVSYAKATVEITNLGVSDQVIVGCSLLHNILLRNEGDTINQYIFDLRSWSTLKLMPGFQTQEKRPVGSDTATITEITRNDSIYSFDSANLLEESKMSGILYMIEVLPKMESQLILQYSPKSPENIDLNIPLILVGGETSSKISLNLRSVPSPIQILTDKVEFGNKVVFESNDITHINAPRKEEIKFNNNTEQVLTWKIEFGSKCELFQKGVFKLEQTQGTIQPKQTETITAIFDPEKAERYETEIFVVVNYLETNAEFPVTIVGTGVKPSIVFDPPEIFLPIAAPGSDSIAEFSIINYGCERTELTVTSDIELKNHNLFLKLEYLESKILKGDGESIQVAFRFGSLDPASPTIPIGFSTKVEFIDSSNNSFFVTVHGINDNSLFSLQSFFWKNRTNYHFNMDHTDMAVKFTKRDPGDDRPLM
jgi:hypothetical protein